MTVGSWSSRVSGYDDLAAIKRALVPCQYPMLQRQVPGKRFGNVTGAIWPTGRRHRIAEFADLMALDRDVDAGLAAAKSRLLTLIVDKGGEGGSQAGCIQRVGDALKIMPFVGISDTVSSKKATQIWRHFC